MMKAALLALALLVSPAIAEDKPTPWRVSLRLGVNSIQEFDFGISLHSKSRFGMYLGGQWDSWVGEPVAAVGTAHPSHLLFPKGNVLDGLPMYDDTPLWFSVGIEITLGRR